MSDTARRPYRLFLHGLGDHPATWTSVRQLLGPAWGSEVPDLYDMSVRQPCAKDSLQALCSRLARRYRPQVPHTIIGHSFGGVLAALLAHTLRVHCVVNIEGNLTPDDCTISQLMLQTADPGDLADELRKLACPDRYVRAVGRCDFEILRADARNLTAASDGPALEVWETLLPKAQYLCGDSVPHSTRRLLAGSSQAVIYPATRSHWIQETSPASVANAITSLEMSCGCRPTRLESAFGQRPQRL